LAKTITIALRGKRQLVPRPAGSSQDAKEKKMSVYMGIDWSVKKHDVAFINEAGSIIAQLTIPQQASGFEKLNRTREQVGVEAAECLVGMCF
jgi:hypothetical protein